MAEYAETGRDDRAAPPPVQRRPTQAARATPAGAARVLDLQASAGNRAVAAMLQRTAPPRAPAAPEVGTTSTAGAPSRDLDQPPHPTPDAGPIGAADDDRVDRPERSAVATDPHTTHPTAVPSLDRTRPPNANPARPPTPSGPPDGPPGGRPTVVQRATRTAADDRAAVQNTVRVDGFPTTHFASAGTVGPAVLQRQTQDGTDYELSEKRAAIEHARTAVGKGKKPKHYAAAMADYLIEQCGGLATDFTNRSKLENACTGWWNKPTTVDDPATEGPAREGLVDPAITYDTDHGDLHFIPNPTDKKSAWDLTKKDAQALMESTITSHLSAIGRNSAGHERGGWAAFYITACHTASVGRYTGQKVKQKWPSTDHFTIQLQVNYTANEISYHGFPDEKIEQQELGLSINKTDPNKLT